MNQDTDCPARNDRVIAVNSTNGDGRWSDFNATPSGERVAAPGQGLWPIALASQDLQLGGGGGGEMLQGTSFTIPPAAAIGAPFLGFMHGRETNQSKETTERMRKKACMMEILRLASKTLPQGSCYYLRPWDVLANEEDPASEKGDLPEKFAR